MSDVQKSRKASLNHLLVPPKSSRLAFSFFFYKQAMTAVYVGVRMTFCWNTLLFLQPSFLFKGQDTPNSSVLIECLCLSIACVFRRVPFFKNYEYRLAPILVWRVISWLEDAEYVFKSDISCRFCSLLSTTFHRRCFLEGPEYQSQVCRKNSLQDGRLSGPELGTPDIDDSGGRRQISGQVRGPNFHLPQSHTAART